MKTITWCRCLAACLMGVSGVRSLAQNQEPNKDYPIVLWGPTDGATPAKSTESDSLGIRKLHNRIAELEETARASRQRQAELNREIEDAQRRFEQSRRDLLKAERRIADLTQALEKNDEATASLRAQLKQPRSSPVLPVADRPLEEEPVAKAPGGAADRAAQELQECRQGLELAWAEMESLREQVEDMRVMIRERDTSLAALQQQFAAGAGRVSAAVEGRRAAEERLLSVEQLLEEERRVRLSVGEAEGGRAGAPEEEAARLEEARQEIQRLQRVAGEIGQTLTHRDQIIGRLKHAVLKQREHIAEMEQAREEARQRVAALEEDLNEARQKGATPGLVVQMGEAVQESKEAARALLAEEELERAREETERFRVLLEGERAAVQQAEAGREAERERVSRMASEKQQVERRLAELGEALEQARQENRERETLLRKKDEEASAARETEKERERMQGEVEDLQELVRRERAALRHVEEERVAERTQVRDMERELAQSKQRIAGLNEELERAAQQGEERDALLRERGMEVRELRTALAAHDTLQRQEKPPPGALTAEEPAALASRVDESPVPPAGPEAEKGAPQETPQGDAPLSPYKLIVDGNRALKSNDLPAAERLFAEALVTDSTLVGARLGLAACSYTRGDFDEAKARVHELLGEDARNAQALGLAGIIAWQEGDLRGAVRQLEEALAIDSSDAQLHNYMGIVQHSRKKHAEALQELRKAVELDPSHAEAKFNLAVLLATDRVPQMEEARRYYESARNAGSDRDEKLEQLLYP